MSAQRLPLVKAAFVVARRDFTAILFSRAFFFFLLGPLFPIAIGVLAGSVGAKVSENIETPQIGIAMAGPDVDAMLRAHGTLARELGPQLPDMVELKRLSPGEPFDPAGKLAGGKSSLAAVVTGTPAAPELTATSERLERWQGSVALIAATALKTSATTFPKIGLHQVVTSGAAVKQNRMRTAQAGLTVLFLLIIMLAGMVMSNLVEEKANKVIEILAAAIPMDAVFLGKLFAMLAVSLVGIAVWASVITALVTLADAGGAFSGVMDFSNLTAPGVGWPLFFGFGVLYFAMGYLLLGSIFLAVGAMATTVREVQTLSMPVTMAQVLIFFLATMAMSQPGSPLELGAAAFPLSSPFVMLARAAQDGALWPHLIGLGWQALWVAIFIKLGASLFRRRVMKSGPQMKDKRRLFSRRPASPTSPITADRRYIRQIMTHFHTTTDRRRLLGWMGAAAALPLVAACSPASAKVYKVSYSDAQWRKRLTKAQYFILRQEGTEAPFTSPLNNEHRKGTFLCAGCANELYSSATKFDSGTGWPSFYQPLAGAVGSSMDVKLGYPRTAIYCADCGGHLGHVFKDGPKPTGLRYCMNGDAMTFRAG